MTGYDATRYLEAQRMCYEVCQHYGLSRASTEMALSSAVGRYANAHTCYAAVLRSLTWEK